MRVTRQKVYVAGPISKGDLQDNIDQARKAGLALIKAGYAPIVPQLTCFMESNTPSRFCEVPHDVWIQVDLPWVMASDAILRLPGESLGADMEVDYAMRLGIPVYKSITELTDNPPPRGHAGYLALLRRMELLHKKKAADYGTDDDPFANIRGAEEIGIEPWRAAYLRSKDKVKRIDTYCLKGSLANECVEDSFLDNAAYNLIALLMFQEQADTWTTTKE